MPSIKKYSLIVACLFNMMWASDIKGIIEAINQEDKTITVSGNIIKVMPYTEIEQDSCGVGWDSLKTFSELSINDIVEVEIFYNEGKMVAKEIEIGCKKNRAY